MITAKQIRDSLIGLEDGDEVKIFNYSSNKYMAEYWLPMIHTTKEGNTAVVIRLIDKDV